MDAHGAPLSAEAAAFLDGLPFRPDRFQLEAIAAIDEGHSVVVTAPTGAGKTLIAEAAVHLAVARGRRAFYTTPIKALSNQKYGDFVEAYGEDSVGLLTGDNVINGDAAIVVMTTEVLRNMIYEDSAALHDLEIAVLDEVHYLQDPYRGSVWEEVIIHLPRRIRLVNLSATIANPEEFTEWMAARRGDVALVVETHRPVPLESLYMLKDRHHEGRIELYPVFGKDGRRPNPAVEKLLRKGRGRFRRFATPRRLEVTRELLRDRLLPAIYFVFSRAGCDQAARLVAESDLRFTNADDRARIRAIATERTAHLDPADLAVLGFDGWLRMLETGAAAHHAGMVPAFKEVVEELFAAGLIQIVFATETLALGINMPARTVVLERLSKFTGEQHEMLQPGDYTQLTGRAGRRGIDTAGTAIVLHSPHVPFDKVASIAAAGSHPLESSFQPSYNMAANLVANYPRERAEELLNASFAQFRTERMRDVLSGRLAALEDDLARFREAAECDRGDIWTYLASDEVNLSHREAMQSFAQRTHPGDVFSTTEAAADRWVLLARGYGPSPRLLLLSSSGDVRRVRPEELPASTARIGHVVLPEPFRPRDTGYQRSVARMIREWTPDEVPAPAVVDEGPPDPLAAVATCPRLADHRRWARRAVRTEREISRLRRRLDRGDDGLVAVFRSILRLMERWGYARGWSLTPKGERLRYVYNELDLLLTEAVEEGVFSELTGAEFAALASLFTYEARARDVPGEWPNPRLEERGLRLDELAARLHDDERRERVPTTRAPESGFAEIAYYWAAGAALEDLFEEDETAAGDFVRNCRQLLDLMRQLRDTFPALAGTASEAIRSVDRGVVAAGGRV